MVGRRGQNEGSIHQRRDGRWVASIELGWGPDGKRKRRHFFAPTRKEVQEKLRAAQRDQTLGIPLAPERQTVEQFLLRWLEDTARPRVREKTFSSYEQLIRVHLIPSLGRLQLQQLTPQHVQSFLTHKTRQGLSNRTVRYLRGLLSNALGTALRWGLVQRNVATLVDPPRAVKREVQPFTAEQARHFLTACQGHRMEAIFVVALLEGLRQGEILGLAWSAIDLEAGTLTVRQALQRVGGSLKLVEPKTKKSKRTIAISPLTVSALRAQRVRQLEDRLLAGAEWQETGLVFTSRLGTPLEPSNVVKRFKAVLRETGLPALRFHDLRHSCASLMRVAGIDARMRQDRLGHVSLDITESIYTHTYAHEDQEVARRMGDLLAG